LEEAVAKLQRREAELQQRYATLVEERDACIQQATEKQQRIQSSIAQISTNGQA
jgi:phage shock protein A